MDKSEMLCSNVRKKYGHFKHITGFEDTDFHIYGEYHKFRHLNSKALEMKVFFHVK